MVYTESLLKISAAMNGAADHPSTISSQIPRKPDMSLLFQAVLFEKTPDADNNTT